MEGGDITDGILWCALTGRQGVEDPHSHRELDGLLRLAEEWEKLSEQLVGDRDLAVVGSYDFGGVVESVAEEGVHIDRALLPYHLDDAVVVHGLVADLRRLKSELLHVPLLEGLR